MINCELSYSSKSHSYFVCMINFLCILPLYSFDVPCNKFHLYSRFVPFFNLLMFPFSDKNVPFNSEFLGIGMSKTIRCKKGTYNQKIIPYNKTNVSHYIELHCKFPTWKEFIETLAHEMVHQWQWEVLSPQRYEEGKTPIMSHGPSFYAWRKPLHKYLIPLTRAY